MFARKTLAHHQIYIVLLVFLATVVFLFQTPFKKGGQIIQEADPAFYYSYVRSIVIDHDVNLKNEFTHLGIEDYKVLPTGYTQTRYTIGFPLLVLPFVLATHTVFAIINLLGFQANMDGYTMAYQLSFCFGSIFYGYLGLVLSLLFLKKYFSEFVAAISVMVMMTTTNLFYYFAIEPFMSELCSFFSVALFLYCWQQVPSRRRIVYFLILGVAAGLMTSIRQQNAAFMIVVAFDLLWNGYKEPLIGIIDLLWRGIFFLGGVLLGFLHQLVVWKIIYGSVLVDSYEGFSFVYKFSPKILQVLFSSNHGLISWHPIFIACLIGLVASVSNHRRTAVLFMFAFLMQLYINASWYYWWFGHSFGHRGFISCVLIFAFGFAYLLSRLNRPGIINLVFVVCIVLSGWNMLLILAYLADMIPHEGFFSWYSLFSKLGQIPLFISEKIRSLM